MKISKTRITLALAVFAPLCALRAAAEEPAWAAAMETGGVLAAIQKVKAPAAPLKTRAVPVQWLQQVPPKAKAAAGGAPASVPDQVWQKILGKLKTKGKYTPEKSVFQPASFDLEVVVGDKKADHHADYVDAFGELNDDDLFEAEQLTFTNQDWKIGADGNWHLDQWVLEMDVYGTVQGAEHAQIVQGKDYKLVAKPITEEFDAADPIVAAKCKTLSQFWAAQP